MAGKTTLPKNGVVLTVDATGGDLPEHQADEPELRDGLQKHPAEPPYLPRTRTHQRMQSYLKWLARRQPYFIHLVRIAIFVVMAWIGGLKFVPYEAESIVPFVANSPVMEFFYAKPAPEYKRYMNKEGELVPKNRAWHQEN